MAQSGVVDFHGREVNIWNQPQLENLNHTVLRSRAMDLRDLVASDGLPRMPRHPEQVIQWILSVQKALPDLQLNPTKYAAEGEGLEQPPASVVARAQANRNERGPMGSPYGHSDTYSECNAPQSYKASPAPSTVGDSTEFVSAYNAGRNAADHSRMRSRGTAGLLSWD